MRRGALLAALILAAAGCASGSLSPGVTSSSGVSAFNRAALAAVQDAQRAGLQSGPLTTARVHYRPPIHHSIT